MPRILTLEQRESPVGIGLDGLDEPAPLRPIRHFEEPLAIRKEVMPDGTMREVWDSPRNLYTMSAADMTLARLPPLGGWPLGGICPHYWAVAWDPSPSELPTANWPQVVLAPDEDGVYRWDHTFLGWTDPITALQIAPPVDTDLPYERTPPDSEQALDYGGYFTTCTDGNGYCPDSVHLEFDSPGIYAGRVTFASGRQLTEFFFAGAEQGNGGEPTPVGRQVEVQPPGADFATIAKPGTDNGWLVGAIADVMPARYGTEGIGWARLTNGVQLRVLSNVAWEDLNRAGNWVGNRPISETIIGHGYQGVQTFSSDDQWGGADAQVQQFAQRMAGKISTLSLWGCEIAWVGYNRPAGLMYELANRLHTTNGPAVTVSGWDQCVSYASPTIRQDGLVRPAYYAVDASARYESVVVS